MAKAKKAERAGDGGRAVWRAIEARDLKAFRKATAGVRDLAALRGWDGKGVLRSAMQGRADKIAMALIDQGFPVAAGDADLIWAVLVRRADLVQRFVALGADVNAPAILGTPLGIAAAPPRSMLPGPEEELLRIMRLLIDAGADVNAGSATGSPLKHAVIKDREPAARLLIDAGADLGDVDELVRWARENGNAALAKAIRAAAKGPRRGAARKPKVAGGSADADVAALESLCGSKAQPFAIAPGAVSVHVHSASGFDVGAAQRRFLRRGKFVFATDSRATRVAMIPGTDKYAAVRAMGTNGDNHGAGNAEVVAWLRALEDEQPFGLTGIGFDFLAGRFLTKVKNPAELAGRMAAFCPDIVEQGVGSVDALAERLRKTRELYFWWD